MRLAQVGDVFSSRYQLLDVLGSGGFATVFRGRDQTIGRDVVVKVLTPQDGRYAPTVRARFLREAQIFGELQSPYIVTMYDFGESAEGLLFMVFEYVAGVELGELIAQAGGRRQGLPPDVVLNLLQQLLSALDESHRKGVLHRDIKPANILVYQYADDPHRVKLLDYGVAKDLSGDAKSLTSTGGVVGTLRYMSPEQLAGETLGPASDIYSLGLVAYEMLVGTPAIAGESQREMILAQIDDNDITVPPHLAPGALRAAIDGMLHKDLAARLRTARDVKQLLQQTVSGHHTSPPRAHVTSRHSIRGPSDTPSSNTLRGVRTGGVPVQPVVEVQPPPSLVRRWAPYVGAVALLIGLVVAVVMFTRPPEDVAAPVVRKSRDALFATNEPKPAEPPSGPRLQTDVGSSARDASAVPESACNKPAPFSGVRRLPTTLESWATFPSSYGAEPMPLVVLFHRAFRTAPEFIKYSKFQALAEEHGFVVVAFRETEQLGYDERLFGKVAKNIEKLFQDHCLDRSRLYLVGDDQGSRIAWTLPCMIPVSAYAVTFDRSARACVPVLPTSRLRVYGVHDRYVPPSGAVGCSPLDGDSASAASFRKNWSKALECGEAQPWGDWESGRCERFECRYGNHAICAGELNHQWPDGPDSLVPWPGCHANIPGELFPIPDAIWKYFSEEGVAFSAEQLAPHVGVVRDLPY